MSDGAVKAFLAKKELEKKKKAGETMKKNIVINLNLLLASL